MSQLTTRFPDQGCHAVRFLTLLHHYCQIFEHRREDRRRLDRVTIWDQRKHNV